MGLGDFFSAVPVIGHVKAATYLVCGEEERGIEIMKAANRSTLVYGSGALAVAATGGLAAAPVAGVLMGVCHDVADTEFSGKPQGFVKNVNRAVDDPSAETILDAAFIPIEDALNGYAGGKSVRAVMSMPYQIFPM